MKTIQKTKTAKKTTKIIGAVTTYHGDEHRYLRGYKVIIIAVLKNAAKPDIDVDGPEYANISDEEELQRAGGVTADDRIEVSPYLEKEGRYSFVSSDPRAIDLACFKSLSPQTKPRKTKGTNR
ncbi:MAG: hypothetical protein JXA30_22285 [Deltaproteobacteria bacterium]|nr:hypothetical protein [Deltaproteobacteria bacterium]